MDYLYVGIIVNTHALKGEVRIISDFEYKDRVFVIGNHLYVGDSKKELIIKTYRPHKQYHMVTFEGIDSIETVLPYKGKKVYFNKSNLSLNEKEFLDNDLIGLNALYNDKIIGTISNIEFNSGKKLIVINDKLIPYNDNFIESVNINKNIIVLKNIEGFDIIQSIKSGKK